MLRSNAEKRIRSEKAEMKKKKKKGERELERKPKRSHSYFRYFIGSV